MEPVAMYANRSRRPTSRGRGAVIAFVGSEASGKSTLLAETQRWLGAQFVVHRVHAGKPPPTLLTAVPNLLLPALRAALPQQRSTRIDLRRSERVDANRDVNDLPPLFAVRSVLLAHDRHALLRRASARAAAGTIVLSDRYPSAAVGAPDSRQLPVPAGPPHRFAARESLARRESRLYDDIPPPDLVFHLTAPLDLVLERNRTRGKTEPEELVRLRHRQASALRFDGTVVHEIDTSRPLTESIEEVRRTVCDLLASTDHPQPGVRPLRRLPDGPRCVNT
jgi:thymidylate kinase